MTASNYSAQNYSSDDMQQILAIAMGHQADKPVPIEEIAAELSIDDASLRYAVDAWRSQQTQMQQKRQRRQRFYQRSLLPYLAVNAFLILLNISLSGAVTWAIYPLLGWGLGLLLNPDGHCKKANRQQPG
ncbi:MAG: 2TM domain-containing protein [Cyanobacteria bacterium J06555_13]